MNTKKRILGGAILTALAGTSAYFCSNNDKTQIDYERNFIEQPNRVEQSEIDFPEIIPSPYLGEKTLEQEIIGEETTKPVKIESLDERISRLSDLLEKYYVTTNEIRRNYDLESHRGEIKTSEGKEIKYSLEKNRLFFRFTPKMVLAIKFQYDQGQINIVRWRVDENDRQDDLVLSRELNGQLNVITRKYEKEPSEIRDIKSNSEVSGFMRWNEIVSNIITRHPELFR